MPTSSDRTGDGAPGTATPAPVQRPDARPGAPLARQDGSWSFAVIGDYGGDTPEQARVAANILRSAPEVVLTLGDNAYPHGSEADFRRGFDPDHLMGGVARRIPVRPAIGNHDVTNVRAEPYFRRFPQLGGARYYSFDLHGVHFVALDSTQSLAPGSPQLEWARRDLEAARDAAWQVVYLHHPLLSDQPRAHNNRRLQHLGPVLARTGVDLVLAGHEHVYDRSVPGAAAGATHVTAGVGGHGLTPGLAPQSAASAWRELAYGHVDVEVQSDRLVGRFVDDSGRVRDTFTVEPVVAARK